MRFHGSNAAETDSTPQRVKGNRLYLFIPKFKNVPFGIDANGG